LQISNLQARLANLFLTSGPVFELDFDTTIERASKLVNLLFPGEEFLPRAPDPEEIIIGGDDEGASPDVVQNSDSNIPEQSNIQESEEPKQGEEKNEETEPQSSEGVTEE
jgi:Rab proteins geranylgeranyltransferase component A